MEGRRIRFRVEKGLDLCRRRIRFRVEGGLGLIKSDVKVGVLKNHYYP